MSKAITLRLDESDFAALEGQAERLQLKPGTLARILVRQGLGALEPRQPNLKALAALDRMDARRARLTAVESVVELLRQSREESGL